MVTKTGERTDRIAALREEMLAADDLARTGFIRMPKGKFVSYSDGAEAGIVIGGTENTRDIK